MEAGFAADGEPSRFDVLQANRRGSIHIHYESSAYAQRPAVWRDRGESPSGGELHDGPGNLGERRPHGARRQHHAPSRRSRLHDGGGAAAEWPAGGGGQPETRVVAIGDAEERGNGGDGPRRRGERRWEEQRARRRRRHSFGI